MIRDKCNILSRFFDYVSDCVSSKFLKFKKKKENYRNCNIVIRDKCNILLRFFHDYDFDCVSSKFLKFKKKKL